MSRLGLQKMISQRLDRLLVLTQQLIRRQVRLLDGRIAIGGRAGVGIDDGDAAKSCAGGDIGLLFRWQRFIPKWIPLRGISVPADTGNHDRRGAGSFAVKEVSLARNLADFRS